MDGSTELGFSEFVVFVVVLKQIERKCRADRKFAKQLFVHGMGPYHSLVQEVAGPGLSLAPIFPTALSAQSKAPHSLRNSARRGVCLRCCALLPCAGLR